MKKSPLNRIGKRLLETDPQRQWKQALKENSLLSKGKPKKNSVKCWEDGIRFDSLWERQCYRELKLTKEHNQKLVRECDFLRNQLNLRSKNRLELVKG